MYRMFVRVVWEREKVECHERGSRKHEKISKSKKQKIFQRNVAKTNVKETRGNQDKHRKWNRIHYKNEIVLFSNERKKKKEM